MTIWLVRAALIGLVAVGVALGPAGSIVAHQPEANRGTPNPDAAYPVPRPDISRSLRGIVPAGARDYYTFSLDQPTALTLWLLVPMVAACRDFQPVMYLWGADNDAIIAEWQGRNQSGAVQQLAVMDDGALRVAAAPWGVFFYRERIHSGPWIRPTLPPGTYLVAIEAPADRGGSYTFAIGDLEIPGGGIDPATMAHWQRCTGSW